MRETKEINVTPQPGRGGKTGVQTRPASVPGFLGGSRLERRTCAVVFITIASFLFAFLVMGFVQTTYDYGKWSAPARWLVGIWTFLTPVGVLVFLFATDIYRWMKNNL